MVNVPTFRSEQTVRFNRTFSVDNAILRYACFLDGDVFISLIYI